MYSIDINVIRLLNVYELVVYVKVKLYLLKIYTCRYIHTYIYIKNNRFFEMARARY